MANLYLTHKCYRGCPFCFARKVTKESSDRDEILTLEEIERFIERFGGPGNRDIPNFGLLGGEPFVYPHLTDLIRLLKDKGISATVFTSATDPLPEGLGDLDPEEYDFGFVVNVGTRDTYSETKFRNLENFFEKFGGVSQLSYTIFDLDADPGFIFDMIDKYGLRRIVRTGIALPIYKGGNTFIALEDYKRAGEYFVKCTEAAAERGITMSMDCGFVACMFDDAQLGRLQRLGGHVNFGCGAAVDIGPRLQVWNCFPLFQLGRVDAMQARNMKHLEELLAEKMLETLPDTAGVFEKCEECDIRKRNLCDGGCKSFKSV